MLSKDCEFRKLESTTERVQLKVTVKQTKLARVTVNFMCRIDQVKKLPDETLFLGGSVRVFLDEVCICISRLSSGHWPPPSRWVPSSPPRARMGQKGWGRRKPSFSLSASWASPLAFSCLSTRFTPLAPWLPGLGLRLGFSHWLCWTSSLQVVDSGASQPP